MSGSGGRPTDADIALLAAYLHLEAGLVLDRPRRPALAALAVERLVATGHRDVTGYLAWLRGADGQEERQLLLDRATVQETQFARNPPQMAALRERVLPELLERAARRGRPAVVWSAGCATGEEAYTLAMLALDLAGPRPPLRVLGTDLSAAAVATARAAVYGERSVALLEEGARSRHLRRDGTGWQVREEVRALVDLSVHNLVTEPAPFAPGSVDLVLCRNVTIYFDRPTTRALVERFAEVLNPAGWLLLGHAETLWQLTDAFAVVPLGEAFAYRPVAARPVPRPVTPPGAARRGLPLRRPRLGQLTVLPPVPAAPLPASPSLGGEPGVGRPAEAPVLPRRRSAARADEGAAALAAARAALEGGAYLEAARLAARAAAGQPLEVAAHLLAGRALVCAGKDAEAVEPLRRAAYLDPRAGDAQFLLAGALSRTGAHAAAAAAYRAAADTLPLLDEAALAALLDGRGVGELAALCRTLAGQQEERAEEQRAGRPSRTAAAAGAPVLEGRWGA
ncbi:MAG TPA: CheR family methyltransferase [Motilibacteraceae bacterium]|nr:CheR family methyltransferase [Motilibacteraceae bacterium]